MKKKIKALLGIASLAAATLIGGTWATGSNELKTGNEFQTAYYNTELVEEFTSPNGWNPGVETEKQVWLANEGEVPVVVKAVLNQQWIRTDEIKANTENGEVVVAEKGAKLPLKFPTDGTDEYAAQIQFNKDAVRILGDGTKAQSEDGILYVTSPSEALDKWLLTSEEPDANGNWEAYYIGVVEPKGSANDETPKLIESVTMNQKLEATILNSKRFYDENKNAWVTVDTVNPHGYDFAEYVLTVNMTTVQATKDAVEEVFKGSNTEILTYLIKDIAGENRVVATEEKKLTIKESNGTLGYVPNRTGADVENGNWFMSFTEMIPGTTYVDEMTLKNATANDFYVYMQIVERSQGQIPNELLDKIFMKVYCDDTLVYNGTARGLQDGSGKNFQKVVSLGLYGKNVESKIRTELMLDPELELEADGSFKYADVLSKIDWKFWVNRPSSSNPPGGGGGGGNNTPRKTVVINDNDVPLNAGLPMEVLGDNMIPLAVLPATGTSWWIVAILVCAAGALIGAGVWRKRKYEK